VEENDFAVGRGPGRVGKGPLLRLVLEGEKEEEGEVGVSIEGNGRRPFEVDGPAGDAGGSWMMSVGG
jgi:hypothetical protein